MPTKINSAGQQQEYDPKTGQYGFKSGDFSKEEHTETGVDKTEIKRDNKTEEKVKLAIPEGENLRARILADIDDKMTIDEIVNDPVIKKAAKQFDFLPEEETVNIDTPERWQLRKDTANKVHETGSYNGTYTNEQGKKVKRFDGQVDKGYRAEIVIGVPAGGKSSVIVNKVSQYTNSRILDSDDIKALLPEFDGGNGAGKVHKESADIILNKLVAPEYYEGGSHKGDNIVIPIVGKNTRAAKMYLENLKKAGYKVHLSFNDVTPLNSAKRATTRFVEEGRFLSPAYIQSVGTKPRETYEQLKREGGFDTYSKYDNNVKMKEKAKKIERLDNKGNAIAWEDWQ